MTDTGSNCRPQPSLRRGPARGNDDCTPLSQQVGGLPRHPRGRTGRQAPTTPRVGEHDGQVPRRPRGASSRQPASPTDAGAPGTGVHHGPRGDDKRGQRHQDQAGGRPSRVHHHPRRDTEAEEPVPSVDALRPYARVLVALAIEVRAGAGTPRARDTVEEGARTPPARLPGRHLQIRSGTQAFPKRSLKWSRQGRPGPQQRLGRPLPWYLGSRRVRSSFYVPKPPGPPGPKATGGWPALSHPKW